MHYPRRKAEVVLERRNKAAKHWAWPCQGWHSFPGMGKRNSEGLGTAFFPIMKIKNSN